MIEWSDSLSLGIESIDDQHRKLVNMINALQEAIDQAETDQVLIDIFDGLAVYTDKHFSYEEQLFEAHGYHEHEAHQREHKVLRDQVLTLKRRFESGELLVTDALMEFLVNWLEEHIQGSDRQYVEFLKNHGVQ